MNERIPQPLTAEEWDAIYEHGFRVVVTWLRDFLTILMAASARVKTPT